MAEYPTRGRMQAEPATSAERPGAANRAFEILPAMLRTARQRGDFGEHVPDTCANIARNPRRPVARYLDGEVLRRLGAKLDAGQRAHPRPVAAVRPHMLTGARLSEVPGLTRAANENLSDDGASVPLADSKTGPRFGTACSPKTSRPRGPDTGWRIRPAPRCPRPSRSMTLISQRHAGVSLHPSASTARNLPVTSVTRLSSQTSSASMNL